MGYYLKQTKVKDLSINDRIQVGNQLYFAVDCKSDKELVLFQSADGTIGFSKNFEDTVLLMIDKVRGFELVSEEGVASTKKNFESKGFIVPDYKEDETLLPLRGSKFSAGYDIVTPVDIKIQPGQTVKFFTNVKAYMQVGEVLLADIRSSVGTNDNVMIANVLPIIDMDYYNNSKNEGNIGIALRNVGDITVEYKARTRVAQLVFIPFLESDNCNSDKDRVGGFGSSGR